MKTGTKLRTWFNFSNTSLVEQYPQSARNGKRELRTMESRPQSGSTSGHRSQTSQGFDTATQDQDSDYPPTPDEAVKDSQVEDFQYRRGREPLYQRDEPQSDLPSPVVTPETEHEISPIVSDINYRNERLASYRQETPKRTGNDNVPTRIRHDFTRSQDDVSSSRRHQRNRSQHSTTHQRHSSRPSSQSRPRPPVRQPSGSARQEIRGSPDAASERLYGPGDRSSAESIYSQETAATSVHTLTPLQTKGPDNSDVQQLEPVIEDDPRSWDLVDPADEAGMPTGMYALERRAEQMFSSDHLRVVFEDSKLLLKFTGFLNSHRPQSIPVLIYYLDALKAIRAIKYANAISKALDPIRGQRFTEEVAEPTKNAVLEEKAEQAFELLVREDLPAYIAHTWIQMVSLSIQRRITGTLAPHLREASEGLAEVFCLTDPNRPDNPIVFASEEFTRTTQYGMNYVIGRNCRFLQGPRTNPNSVRRLALACQKHREHTEVFVNYRRDGNPFMNLLMIAPLMDSRGNTRYYIGAQVDVSGLIKECSNLESLVKLVDREQDPEAAAEEDEANKKDEIQELSEMFNGAELETVRKYGGRMHKEYADESDRESSSHHSRRRLLLKDPGQDALDNERDNMVSSVPQTVNDRVNGKLEGIYQHVSAPPPLRLDLMYC